VQLDPIKPMLKPPISTRLTLNYDEPLSSFAFNSNSRRYIKGYPGKSKKGELSIFPCHLEVLTPCLHMLPGYSAGAYTRPLLTFSVQPEPFLKQKPTLGTP